METKTPLKICIIALILSLTTPVLALEFNADPVPTVDCNQVQTSEMRCFNSVEKDKESAVTTVKDRILEAARLAGDNQTEECQKQVTKFNSSCKQSDFEYIEKNINAVKAHIDQELSVKESLINETSNPKLRNNEGVVASMIERLTTIKNSIDTDKSSLEALNQTLTELNNSCINELESSRLVCVQPTVSTIGDTVIIKQTTTSQSFANEVNAVEELDYASATVAASGVVESKAIVDGLRTVEGRHGITSMASDKAFESLDLTNSYATTSSQQIENIIESLRPLSTSLDSPGACAPRPGRPCPSTGADDDSIAAGALEAIERAEAAERARIAAEAERKSSPGPGSSAGTASADDLGNDAMNSAFGGTPGDSDPSGSPTGASGSNPNGSGLAGALSGLTSMMGKTSGDIGDSSSYGSDYGNYRSNSNGSNGSSYTNNPNPDYNNNSFPAIKTSGTSKNQQPQARGFQPQSQGATQPNGFGAGQGSNVGGFDSSSAGASAQDSKPGLFSRLFGKKDKNMFGKTTGSGGGGSLSGANKAGNRKTSSGSSYEEMDPANPSLKNGRTFDPNKYMPSKDAEERAYLRSTGRKMASRGLASASDFQWPDDISRNKNANLFKTVNLIHRAKLAQ